MLAARLTEITGIGLDSVAAAAGEDAAVLRLENLDTDISVPEIALAETRRSISDDRNNSWLPLTGRMELRSAVAARLNSQTGIDYDPNTQVVITCGGQEGLLDTLLAVVDPGNEVILTDPTYAGMINRTRLVGGVPVFVQFRSSGNEWRLDLDRLADAVTPRTRSLFIMNPSMPSGAVLNQEEWNAIAATCIDNDLWLIYNAAMENILFDGRPYFHPASLDGMAERTITVGSASKEYRMIGWKVGWVVGPEQVMEAIGTVHIYNTADAVGLTQTAVAAVVAGSEEDTGVEVAIAEWQKRRDVIVDELSEYNLIPAAGGWSMLLEVGQLGFTSVEASERLLSVGKIAATYMRDWGHENSDQYVRLVFSNEPVERLTGIGEKTKASLPI